MSRPLEHDRMTDQTSAVADALDEAQLDAVTGGIRSPRHGAEVSTQGGTTVDDFKRAPIRGRHGEVIWTEIDEI